jgi:hypothetical protein
MTKQELQHIFESPFNWDNWRKVMDFVFPEFQYALRQEELPLDTAQRKRDAIYIRQHGATELSDKERIVLYEIALTEKVRLDRNVKSVRKLISSEIFAGYQLGLGVFHNEDKTKWRFTLVIREFTPAFTISDKKPESYTYVFGEGERGRTAAERFFDLSKIEKKKLKDLEVAFSVEALSKKFFTQYKEVYVQFVNNIVENPSRLNLFKGENRDKVARDFVKKMMGRIVFLYFLQKKGWMGCPTKWENGDAQFMQTLFDRAGADNPLFYSHFLQPLFFDTLNAKRTAVDEDCIISEINFGKVPFLNGGLFEREENHPDTLTIDWDIFQKFFDILNSYNFTIIEDDPDFKEVAVDPEMLGHIFENLLEDNKDKGAFYTPKEIVQYMCQESLIEYLNTQLSKNITDEKLKDSVRDFVIKQHFVGLNDINQQSDKYVLQALRDIKVCDPAIGSGAFPMGILQEIFRMVEALEDRDIFQTIWKMEAWDAARVKEAIIQNSIYGVDIEKGAVDIARLRFWLSIIIDEKAPTPLPNLDYKIVVGDSLLNKFEDHVIEIEWEIKEGTQSNTKTQEFLTRRSALLQEISEKQNIYFDTESINRSGLSQEIKDLKIDILINQLEIKIAEEGISDEPKAHNFQKKSAFIKAQKLHLQTLEWMGVTKELSLIKGTNKPFNHFDWKLDFPEVLNPILNLEKMGFDVVIGNPPYGIWINVIDKIRFKLDYPLASYKINLYILFIERTLKLFENSLVNYIIPQSLLNNSFFAKIREYLLKNCSLHEIYLIGEKVFEDAEVGGSLILTFGNKKPVEGHKIKIFKSTDFENNSLKISFNLITQSEFLKIQGFEISATSDIDFALIVRLSQLDRVVDRYELKNGLNPGNIKSKLISKSKSSSLYRRIIWGKNLNRYEVKWGGDYVLYDPDISVSVEDMQSKEGMKKQTKPDFALREVSLFETQKIIVRKTGDKLIASLDENDNYYFDTLIHGIYIKDTNYSLEFLLAILNSKAATGIYRILHDVKGKVFAKVSLINLKNFPIPNIDKSKRDYLGHLSSQILNKRLLNQNTEELEKKIDQLVYKMYDMSYEQVQVIEDGQLDLSEDEYNNFSLDNLEV